MKAVILAGGFGTRLSELTGHIPKPMVEIGGKPILWHIMNIFAAHGVDEFILALGYKSEIIKAYFLNFFALNNDFSIDLSSGATAICAKKRLPWKIHLVDTGLATQTGGRLKRLKPWIGDEPFMMTYGDGVADIDVKELLAFHASHEKLATVTATRPPARFGGLVLEGRRVTQFTEKNQSNEGWINGGFFVLDPRVLDLIEGDETIWEKEPLEKLSAEGELMAYFHDRFWQPMDTLREYRMLESLWQSGNAPWKIWNDEDELERQASSDHGSDRLGRLLAHSQTP